MKKINIRKYLSKSYFFLMFIVVPNICSATALSKNGDSANQPWNEGFKTMIDWITGDVTLYVGTISLAAFLIMWSTGKTGAVSSKILGLVMAIAAAGKAYSLMQFATAGGTLFR